MISHSRFEPSPASISDFYSFNYYFFYLNKKEIYTTVRMIYDPFNIMDVINLSFFLSAL